MKPEVFVTKINNDLNKSIRKCFDEFGGLDNIIKGDVFIKINACMPDLTAMTDIDVILETVKVVQTANPKPKNIYVFDSAAVGFPTRVVYQMENLAKRIKKLGAIPLYLDEQPSVDVNIGGNVFDYPCPIPKILHEKLIEEKGKNTFINIPRLKTHLHVEVTACIKNLHGLIYDEEKVYRHHMMHEKVVDIYKLFKPDINIVEATSVPNHGNFAFQKDWMVPFDLLIAGTDAVAVDTVCANLLGVDAGIIGYLNIAGGQGLGVNNYNDIEILPGPEVVEQNKKELNYLVKDVPISQADGLTFIRGKEKCCTTGCAYLEFFMKYLTTGSKCKPLVIVAGKGHDTSELDKYAGPFLVNGPCPVAELTEYFNERKKGDKKLKIRYVDEHFHLTKSMMGIVMGAKIPPMAMMNILQIPMTKFMAGFIGAMMHRARFIKMM